MWGLADVARLVLKTVCLSFFLFLASISAMLGFGILNWILPFNGYDLYFGFTMMIARIFLRQLMWLWIGGALFLWLLSFRYVRFSLNAWVSFSLWGCQKITAWGEKLSLWQCGVGLFVIAWSVLSGESSLFLGQVLITSSALHFGVFKGLNNGWTAVLDFFLGPKC